MDDARDSGDGVGRVDEGLVAAAGRTLGAAFASDPVFRWMVPGVERGAGRLQAWFAAVVRDELRKPHHLVEHVAQGAAVALWHEADDWKASPASILRTAVPSLALFRGRTVHALRVLGAMERSHPEGPHRHLMYIGVDPSRQGSGLGGRLLADAVDRCDAAGLPAYLENSNPRNAPLYARYGFVDHHVVDLPGDAPPLHAMWRDPR